MSDYQYQRVLLKISGEALMGEGDYGIDPAVTDRLARDIKALHDEGLQIGIVVGGGKHFPRYRRRCGVAWTARRPTISACSPRS